MHCASWSHPYSTWTLPLCWCTVRLDRTRRCLSSTRLYPEKSVTKIKKSYTRGGLLEGLVVLFSPISIFLHFKKLFNSKIIIRNMSKVTMLKPIIFLQKFTKSVINVWSCCFWIWHLKYFLDVTTKFELSRVFVFRFSPDRPGRRIRLPWSPPCRCNRRSRWCSCTRRRGRSGTRPARIHPRPGTRPQPSAPLTKTHTIIQHAKRK